MNRGHDPSLVGVLSIPDFRRLLVSNGLWWQSMWMEMIVVGWLVLELTDSPWQVAVVSFYRSIPMLVWGLFSGAVIDRVGRRTTILTCQSINLLGAATIGALIWSGQLALWHLWVVSFVLGSAWAFDWPARRSYTPDLVGKARTVDAMMLEHFGQIVSRILGPFSGGVLIDAIGPDGCYAVLVGISFLSLIGVTRLSILPRRADAALRTGHPVKDVIDGFRYVRHNEAIFGTFLITLVMNNLSFPYMTLLPVFARDVLGQGATGLGILGTGNGIGALCGLSDYQIDPWKSQQRDDLCLGNGDSTHSARRFLKLLGLRAVAWIAHLRGDRSCRVRGNAEFDRSRQCH